MIYLELFCNPTFSFLICCIFSFFILSIFYWFYCYSSPNVSLCLLLLGTPILFSNTATLVHVQGSCVSSSASPFYTIINPHVICFYQLHFSIPASFPNFLPFTLPADNLLNDLHTYDSAPILVVSLVVFIF